MKADGDVHCRSMGHLRACSRRQTNRKDSHRQASRTACEGFGVIWRRRNERHARRAPGPGASSVSTSARGVSCRKTKDAVIITVVSTRSRMAGRRVERRAAWPRRRRRIGGMGRVCDVAIRKGGLPLGWRPPWASIRARPLFALPGNIKQTLFASHYIRLAFDQLRRDCLYPSGPFLSPMTLPGSD